MISQVPDRIFNYTSSFTSSTFSARVFGFCSNRINIPEVRLDVTIHLKWLPEVISNFSLELDNRITSNGSSFNLYLIFSKGNNMGCNVTSISAGILKRLTYTELLTYQQSYTLGRKAYVLPLSTNVASRSHRLDVICRNVISEVISNISLQVQVPIADLNINLSRVLCYNDTLYVATKLSQGTFIYKSLAIDSFPVLKSYSDNMTSSMFAVSPKLYGSPGWKNVTVRAWNNVSASTSAAAVRIAENITGLDMLINFTMSSSQALGSRPDFVVPVHEWINFTAVVSPNASGYLYSWGLNGNATQVQTANKFWSYYFTTVGKHTLNVTVDGCNKLSYEAVLTVLSPVNDFPVTINPFPMAVVNKTVLLTLTVPAHSECMQFDFGDGTAVAKRCKKDQIITHECDIPFAKCAPYHVFRLSGNYTISVTASNALYARRKEFHLAAKSCYKPVIHMQGM